MKCGEVELLPPETNIASTTSSNKARKASSAPLITAKRICGSITPRKARAREAPRLRATNSWFRSAETLNVGAQFLFSARFAAGIAPYSFSSQVTALAA